MTRWGWARQPPLWPFTLSIQRRRRRRGCRWTKRNGARFRVDRCAMAGVVVVVPRLFGERFGDFYARRAMRHLSNRAFSQTPFFLRGNVRRERTASFLKARRSGGHLARATQNIWNVREEINKTYCALFERRAFSRAPCGRGAIGS